MSDDTKSIRDELSSKLRSALTLGSFGFVQDRADEIAALIEAIIDKKINDLVDRIEESSGLRP